MTRRVKRKRSNWITAITVMILAISAFVKIFHVRPISDDLQKVGVGKFMILIGVVELSLAILYIARRSLKLSFILLSCFFSGAIATEISHGGNFVVPAMFLALVWVATFLREPSLLSADDTLSKKDQNPWNIHWTLE